MNNQLTHDFLKWLMDNYSVRLSVSKEDSNLFERHYPDLAARMNRKMTEEEFIETYCINCTNSEWGKQCSHYNICFEKRGIKNEQ